MKSKVASLKQIEFASPAAKRKLTISRRQPPEGNQSDDEMETPSLTLLLFKGLNTILAINAVVEEPSEGYSIPTDVPGPSQGPDEAAEKHFEPFAAKEADGMELKF